MGSVRYQTFFDEVFETEFCFFRKRTPAFRSEIISEDTVKTGAITDTTTFQQEIPNRMSSTPMNLRAYEKVCDQK